MTAPSPEEVFAQVAMRPGSIWLDGGHADDGWSILAWDPVEVVTDGTDWQAVGRRLTQVGAVDESVPFSGGCIGYLGYGAGHRVEPIPASAATPEPEIWLGAYEGALCFHHGSRTWQATGTTSAQQRGHALLASAVSLPPPPPPHMPSAVHTVQRSEYVSAVQRILQWIHDGDCYQVNMTRPVALRDVGSPWPAYRRLRAISGPAYGSFLRLDAQLSILCNSPELFLQVHRDQALARPIKGTRPRGLSSAQDEALGQALMESLKDRAELTMIVDLVRNDLGRVAVPGTVWTSPRVLTTHANVHHTSQDVGAQLRHGRDGWSALAATFPPGSVTGAPKIRACQRIHQLETTPRGIYCGAIGYASRNQRYTWSVAIRVAVWQDQAVRYHVGGGIVAASDPLAEWQETIDKGTVLATAIAGHPTPETMFIDADSL